MTYSVKFLNDLPKDISIKFSNKTFWLEIGKIIPEGWEINKALSNEEEENIEYIPVIPITTSPDAL